MKAGQKILPPLYYAIILHFLDGKADSAQGVVEALSPNYSGYRLLTLKDVEEALATAKENGLLLERDYIIADSGELEVSYQISDFGKEMVRRYLD